MNETLIAVLVGVVQGVLEWIPVSSEGGVAVLTAAVAGADPHVATQLALFLHGGTAISALAYYRREVAAIARTVPEWVRDAPFRRETADLSFLALATVATGLTGVPAYLLLETLVSDLAGGAFLAAVGGLLVLTGLLQRFAESVALEPRSTPDWVDAILVGSLQGVAILPGVSRSGTTVSALLLRGHGGERSLRLSFLLSIPAALAANALILADEGVPAVSPVNAAVALGVSAVVGYLTVGVLVGLVRRIPFWQVCVGFGALGVLGGGLAMVL